MIRKHFFSCLILILLTGCAGIKSFTNLFTCDFRMESISNLQLAGINIQGKQQIEQLNLFDLGQITASIVTDKLPLTFNLNIEALNPNSQKATLNAFDWILLIDDHEVTSGTNNQLIDIPANNESILFPMSMELNLLETFSGKSRSSLLNLALNIADASGKPSHIGFKIKPTVYVNNSIPIEYPGYITLGTEFGNK